MLNDDAFADPESAAGDGSPPALTPERCEQWAALIHDQPLQSLGLCMLQTDLCRRLFETGQEQQALAELQGVSQELDSTVTVLRQLISELLAVAKAERSRS